MEILITSKTKKGKAACVGGLVISNNKFVRLLNPGNWDQYADTDFEISDIWDINYTERQDVVPPHIEDVIIQSKKFVRKIENITKFILEAGVTVYRGSPNEIFNGLLGWTHSGSGYINKNNIPPNSVGFWISDKDLILDNDEKHYNYVIETPFGVTTKRLPYVGFETKVNKIPAGILMRISLARWWKPENTEIDERCYLQLSGWYGLTNSDTTETNIDLPW